MNRPNSTWTIAGLLAAAFACPALAETITVTATGDVVDFGGAQQVGDLPGPDGTVALREAVLAANNTVGVQTIAFNIPVSDPNFNGSVFRIKYTSSLVLSDDGTTIDGFTQTEFTGDTSPGTPEISISGQIPGSLNVPGIRIDGNDSVVTGVGGFNWFRYGIEINGNGNTVAGVMIVQSGSAAVHINGDDNLLDGTQSEIQNRFSSAGVGVWIRATGTGNQVIGNLIQSNHSDGVNVEGNDNVVGGAAPGHRNVINTNGHTSGESHPVGAQVSLTGDGNTVQGNYLGVDETGLLDQSGSARTGVFIDGTDNLVGGVAPGEGNVIAGMSESNVSTRYGVQIVGGTGNAVQGNLIGVGADGATPIPNERNVAVDVFLFANVPADTLIGGDQPGAGNVIAHSVGYGVGVMGFVSSNPTGITIQGNSIFANAGLGIDLAGDGMTPNDLGDADAGPNRRQNFPILTGASVSGSIVMINGTLNSVALGSFVIEFFANDACDPSGHGEGQVHLGSVDVQTDAVGDASFQAALPAGPLAAVFITATATRSGTGDTSEFSACVEALNDGTVPGDLDGDGDVGFGDLLILLAEWGPCAECGACPADVDGDCTVGLADLLFVLSNWS